MKLFSVSFEGTGHNVSFEDGQRAGGFFVMHPSDLIRTCFLVTACAASFAAIADTHPGISQREGQVTILVTTQTANISVPIRSWRTLCDAGIVKQDLDFSCGAASLATLLNQFYGQSVSEESLLKAMDKGDLRASFADMQRALPQRDKTLHLLSESLPEGGCSLIS